MVESRPHHPSHPSGAHTPADRIIHPAPHHRAKPRRAYGALLIALCAILIAIAALPPVYPHVIVEISRLTGLQWPVTISAPASVADTALTQRVAQLESQAQKLNAAQAAAASSAATDQSAAKIASLETQIVDLKATLAAQKTELAALLAKNAEIQKLVQSAIGDTRGLEKRLAVVLALQAAIVNGRPFTVELDWLRQYSNDDVTAAVTDLLLPYAKRGVAPMNDLRDALEQSDFVETVRNTSLSDLSMVNRVQRATMNWFGDIGLTQKPSPLPIDAILDEMRLAMARGQLADALKASAKLEGPAAAMMAPWTSRAKARLMAEEVAQRLLMTTLQQN